LAVFRSSNILANYNFSLISALGIQEYPLNYTDWLKVNYPELESASSVETYSYIKQAKKGTRLWRELFGMMIIIALVLLLNMLLASQGFVPFESVFYWCSFVIVILISSYLANKLEQNIIKSKLHKIVKSKHA